jgi:hypothetical protein
MNRAQIVRVLLVLAVAGPTWAIGTPADAQLASGCSCPAGTFPVVGSSTTCTKSPVQVVAVPAICPSRNIGHIAAAAQQLSFWGIDQMLQQKRDQMQSTPMTGGSTTISGYASSPFDSNAGSLAGTNQSQQQNPLASGLFNAAPAAAAPANPVIGTWVQGLGDWEHDNALSSADAAHANATYTVQGGLDRTWQSVIHSDDALVVGVVASDTNVHISYDGTPITLQMTGPGVGIYTQYVRAGFSADLTTKFDFLTLNQDFAGTAPNSSVSVINAGVSGNAQYKFTGDHNNFVEPTVGFSLTHTGFGSNGQALNLEDAYTVRLQAGGRVGTTWDGGNGVTIDANFKALVYGDAVAQGTSIAGAGSFTPAISPTDTGLVRGELDPELCFNLPNNTSVSLSGQVRFGQALIGGSAGINLRKQW